MKGAHFSPQQKRWIEANQKQFYTMARKYVDAQMAKAKPFVIREKADTFDKVLKRRNELIGKATKAEKDFYELLELMDIRFEKQYPIRLKRLLFFADAYIPDCVLVVEIDGGYHKKKDQQKADKWRTAMLEAGGYKVLRFENEQVKDRVFILSTLSDYGVQIEAHKYI